MPSYTRGKLRDKNTYVLLSNTPSNIYYNWNTKDLASLANVNAADLTTALGHLDSVADGSIVFVGARSPKPPTVRKITNKAPGVSEQGSVSTFCARGNLTTAAAAGWKLAKGGRAVTVRKDTRNTTSLAKISNEAVYASPMNSADWAAYNTQLGLIDPASVKTEAARAVIVSGASRPRAGHAYKVLSGGVKVSSYFSYTADLGTNGWTIDAPEIP